MTVRAKVNIPLLLISFLLLAFAQPDWSVLSCMAAASFGYALFWKSILPARRKFLWALAWFTIIQLIHFNWFFSDRYVGIYIYPFLALLTLFLGAQFGLLTLFIGNIKRLTLTRMLAVSGAWVLLEWARLFILSGFSWNPSGLALSAPFYGLQFASLFGVFGLSFWLMLTNLLAFKWLTSFSFKTGAAWGAVTLIPYFFGFSHAVYHLRKVNNEPNNLNTVLVQTAIAPEEKISINGSEPASPLMQWERILSLLFSHKAHPVDLIVLSEAVVPYGTDWPIYPIDSVKHSFESFFGNSSFLPKTEEKMVGNSFWAQALANAFGADVAIGLEDAEFSEDHDKAHAYNAAFLFHPFAEKRDRYEKRVLVPMGEYIPFNWCRKILSKYGIEGAFTPGKEAKVFSGKGANFAMSICYEETYGNLMRKSREGGAEVLINLTNDVWYPNSRLPIVHYLHGRLRAVENGMPLLRSCNTGVTCGLDSLGRVVGMLDYENRERKPPREALCLSLPLYHYPTLYTALGDLPIISFSFACLFVFFIKKIKLLRIKEINVSLLRKN